MKERHKNIKKIKNILNDRKLENNNEFDLLFLIDATGSMGPYIKSAKEEANKLSEEIKGIYPNMFFKYGYIFYRDPIDSKSDIHELINLTDDTNSLIEKIGKIRAYGGGDTPEDWASAYKMANENINWRNGKKIIIHLADAGAHGRLFTNYDKYPDEENKLIQEIEKCAFNNVNIFGYIINESKDCRNSFEQCSKIYRNNGGSFEIFDFPMKNNSMMNAPMPMNNMMNASSPIMNNSMMNATNLMRDNNMMNAPMSMNNMMNVSNLMRNNNIMNAPMSMNNMMNVSNPIMNNSMMNASNLMRNNNMMNAPMSMNNMMNVSNPIMNNNIINSPNNMNIMNCDNPKMNSINTMMNINMNNYDQNMINASFRNIVLNTICHSMNNMRTNLQMDNK